MRVYHEFFKGLVHTFHQYEVFTVKHATHLFLTDHLVLGV